MAPPVPPLPIPKSQIHCIFPLLTVRRPAYTHPGPTTTMSPAPPIATLPTPSPPCSNPSPHRHAETSSSSLHLCTARLYSTRRRRRPMAYTAHHRATTLPTPTSSRCWVANWPTSSPSIYLIDHAFIVPCMTASPSPSHCILR